MAMADQDGGVAAAQAGQQGPLEAAQALLASAPSSTVWDFLQSAAAQPYTDDQLYIAVGHLLKSGAALSAACTAGPAKQPPPRGTNGASAQQQQQPEEPWPPHEVAWLTQRVATRTLALLIKQRPAAADRIKDYATLKAGVLSNKEYTLLFLKARGADFRPRLDDLIVEAIRHGASKALPWLFQWQDDLTPEWLRGLLQRGLPDAARTPCADVAASLEVLLLHGLSANCTLADAVAPPPTASTSTSSAAPNGAGDAAAASERSLLEWAVLHAAASLQHKEACNGGGDGSRAGTPPADQAGGGSGSQGQSQASTSPAAAPAGSGDALGRRSGSVPDLAAIAARAAEKSSGTIIVASEGGAPPPPPPPPPPELLLLRVALAHGAAVNARRGAALLAAVRALRGDLVAELVGAGAEVALPRLPNGSDLLRWAASSACPPSSGVLQALLGGVSSSATSSSTAAAQASSAPSAGAAGASTSAASGQAAVAGVPGGKGDAPASDRGSGQAAGGGERAGPHTPAAPARGVAVAAAAALARAPGGAATAAGTLAPGSLSGTPREAAPPPSPAPGAASVATSAPSTPALSVVTGMTSIVPMVTVGGQAALVARLQQSSSSDPQQQGEGTEASGGSGSTSKGSLLPSTLLSELQRDAAFLDAVARNDLQVVRTLLEAGADVHYKQDKAILLAMGAIDNDQPDKWLPRPRDRAPVLSMSRPLVELLVKHGADVNARQGRALCQAARWRDDYSMSYILALPGADGSWLDRDPVVQQQRQREAQKAAASQP